MFVSQHSLRYCIFDYMERLSTKIQEEHVVAFMCVFGSKNGAQTTH